MKRALTLFLLSVCTGLYAMAGGTVTGKIVDKETGEMVMFANVYKEGTTIGTTSDFNGQYMLQLEAGTHDITVSFVSYQTKTITGVEVKEGQVTTLDILMETSAQVLEAVVVEAKAVQRNEVALLRMQQKSNNVLDGISSREIRALGLNNSAESMKRVTGVSIEGGKFAVIRGLGDRYSLSQMNGVTLPSADPYRNSVSLDMIPANMIDNTISLKTFTPDRPGNYSGGLIDVKTKSLPDGFYLNTSIGLSFNSISSFNSDFQVDPLQGRFDFLGYDDGTRAIPEYLKERENIQMMNSAFYVQARSNSEASQEATDLYERSSQDLSSAFQPTTRTSLLNHQASFSFGDRKKVNENYFGYNVSFRFNKSYDMRQDYETRVNEFIGGDIDVLKANQTLLGTQSTVNPEVGGLVSFSYQMKGSNQISADIFYNHSADFMALEQAGDWPAALSGDHIYRTRGIAVTERQMFTTQLRGEHVLKNMNNTQFNWVLGRSQVDQSEPDIRMFADLTDIDPNNAANNIFKIERAELSYPFHFYRDLNDQQYNAQFDFETKVGEGKKSSIKYGGLVQLKNRSFNEDRLQLSDEGTDPSGQFLGFTEADGDYAAFFNKDNFGIIGQEPNGRNMLGLGYVNQTNPANQYTGSENVYAAYGMTVLQLGANWKFIGGVRAEVTDMTVTAGNDSVGDIFGLDILPSLGVIRSLNENSNLRLNASQTLARPNMREMAPFTSFDFLGGPQFVGNPNVQRSKISNFDIRYEVFPKPGSMFAVSGFFKYFQNPIMQQLESIGSVYLIEFVNVEDGMLGGIELDYRTGLDVISESLKDFKFAANFTYTFSRVDLTDEEIARNAILNPELPTWRPFQAQSPYLANANLTWKRDSSKLAVSLFANIYGRRLVFNGVQGAPDVYEILSNSENNIPTPDLNFIVNKGIGDKWNVRFSINNILNTTYSQNQIFFDEYYSVQRFKQGVRFGLNVRYSI
jgi:TonB-dependent receptor